MDTDTDTVARRRRARRAAVDRLATGQDAVVTRAQVYVIGLTRGEVRAELRARRWRAIGSHCLVTHTGPLTLATRHWAAVLEAGPRSLVDGDSALVLAGLTRFEPRTIRVSVPRGARIRRPSPLVDIRQTRRWAAEDRYAGPGVPRTRAEVAAVRAVLWARSEREATLVLTMAVQQGVVTVPDVARELLRVRRDRRRGPAQGLLAGGIGSLGELDVVRGCQARGLPEPESQAVRRSARGTSYIDVRWPRWKVVVEVDGVQHSWAEQLVDDALRHNTIALDGDVVRLPMIGLRMCPDAFFDQVAEALRAAGWSVDVIGSRRPDDRSA